MKLLPKALLLAFTITCAAAPSAVAEKRVALVIGNESYPSAPLNNPSRDARVMAEVLQKLGFSLVGGGPRVNLSKVSTDAMVEAFGRDAKNADIAVFYFSGHGMQVDGVNYLAPVDLGSYSRATVSSYTLNAEVLLRVMDSSGARLKIILLDACRTNPFLKTKGPAGGLAQMQVSNGIGMVIGFATRPDTTASDGPKGGNSPYAKALKTYLGVPGLDVFALLDEVGAEVLRATKNEQQPWIAASPLGRRVYLNPPAGSSPAGTPPSIAAAVTSNGASYDYVQEAHKQLNRNNYLEARAILTRAIGVDPGSPLPYSYRGYTWYLEGKGRTNPSDSLSAYREGFPDLDEAIRLDPNYAPVRRHRGNMIVATYKALRALKKPVNDTLDRAITDLEDAVRLNPSKTNINALGEAYLLKGSYNLAIKTFTNAIAKDATYAAPYDGMCMAYRMLGHQTEAGRFAREAAQRDSDLRSQSCLTRSL